jgi:hypothetical protein
LPPSDFAILSVNPGLDSIPAIEAHWKQGKFPWHTIAVARDDAAVLKLGVTTFPTNVLIDKDGKVVWRATGFDATALTRALRRAGLEPN